MTYIIAEVGGNHDGNLDKALELVREARQAGADAVKFQIYDAEKLVKPDLPAFNRAKGYKYQIDRFRDLEFEREDWLRVVGECHDQDIDFLATCFDLDSLDYFAPFMKYIKIASGDLTYKELIEKAGSYGKPVILSTGMATFDEIQMASKWVPQHLLTVLHCVSVYPCPDASVGLLEIERLRRTYARVGYSDHSIGNTACLAAVSLGAQVIEKHFTLDNSLDYGDHPHSANPIELKELVENIRRIEKMRTGLLDNRPEFETNRFRRGGYAARDLKAGDIVQAGDVASLRPANLLMPHEYIGQKLTRDIKKGESLEQ